MKLALILIAAGLACLALTSRSVAQQQGQFGTAEEAKVMLLRAVAGLRADKAKTLDMINKGQGGFLDRDLYPFCFNAGDGKAVAAASANSKQALGQDVRRLVDATGKQYGLELYAAAQKPEGQITEVGYMFPTPSDANPVPKVSFVTRAAGMACGVGYYKTLAPSPQPPSPQPSPPQPPSPQPPSPQQQPSDNADGL
jgi:hypothetical protein